MVCHEDHSFWEINCDDPARDVILPYDLRKIQIVIICIHSDTENSWSPYGGDKDKQARKEVLRPIHEMVVESERRCEEVQREYNEL